MENFYSRESKILNELPENAKNYIYLLLKILLEQKFQAFQQAQKEKIQYF